jgi:prevent-host-death family protein
MSKNDSALVHTIPASEARVHFGEVLRRVYAGKEHIIVEKGGLPVVAIIPFSDFEEWQRLQAPQRFERLSRAAGLEAQRQGLTEEQLEQERSI